MGQPLAAAAASVASAASGHGRGMELPPKGHFVAVSSSAAAIGADVDKAAAGDIGSLPVKGALP
jgi:hypothetical protein